MTTPIDPNAYLTCGADGAFETSYTPVPEGEYPAIIDDVIMRVVEFKSDIGVNEQRLVCQVIWSVLDDAVKAALGMAKVTVRQNIFVDLTADGRLDTAKNKNVELGRLREAVGQNQGAWNIAMLRNSHPACIKISTRPDKDDETKICNDVKSVRRLEA